MKIGSAKFLGHAPEQGAVVSTNGFLRKKENGANVFIEIEGELKGSCHLHNRYREHAWEVVGWFRQKARTFLLSGDNERERDYLLEKFGSTEEANAQLHFHQSPKDKLAFLKKLQSEGNRTLMIGDGLNDAGALKQSDVGIVVAENTNNFTPACDAILDARQFGNLPRFLAFARKSIHVVYAAWGLAAIYNVIGLSYAVQGALSPIVAAILMPASSITIVGFGVGLSTLLSRRMLRESPSTANLQNLN